MQGAAGAQGRRRQCPVRGPRLAGWGERRSLLLGVPDLPADVSQAPNVGGHAGFVTGRGQSPLGPFASALRCMNRFNRSHGKVFFFYVLFLLWVTIKAKALLISLTSLSLMGELYLVEI